MCDPVTAITAGLGAFQTFSGGKDAKKQARRAEAESRRQEAEANKRRQENERKQKLARQDPKGKIKDRERTGVSDLSVGEVAGLNIPQ
jgi:hypothetical protein